MTGTPLTPLTLTDRTGIVVFEGTSSGGGSAPPIIVPLAFDTPGLALVSYSIAAVDQLAQSITIAGSHAADFPTDGFATIDGSTGNDGTGYTIASAVEGGGNTVVTLNEALADGTADGLLSCTSNAGIVLYTPALGDTLLLNALNIVEAFDTSSPGSAGLWLYPEGRDYTSDYVGTALIAGADPGANTSADWRISFGGSTFLATPMWAATTTPLRLVLDHALASGRSAPGSTLGQATLRLLVSA